MSIDGDVKLVRDENLFFSKILYALVFLLQLSTPFRQGGCKVPICLSVASFTRPCSTKIIKIINLGVRPAKTVSKKECIRTYHPHELTRRATCLSSWCGSYKMNSSEIQNVYRTCLLLLAPSWRKVVVSSRLGTSDYLRSLPHW